MYGRRRSPLLEPVLGAASVFYGLLVRLRLGLYRIGILKRKRSAQRVISIGNLTLGGTGKTPAVIQVADVLLKHGKRPAVISRGYGRKDESEIIAVSDGKNVLVDTRTGGDEPVLIASKLAGIPVVAGSNRFRAALFAHRQFATDIVILDDGFQHLRLHRNLDIVLIDAADPFGNGNLFPSGILRERPDALRRAHAVLISGTDRADVEAIKRTIRRHTGARIFTSCHVPTDLVDVMTGRAEPFTVLRGISIIAVAGIARPSSFLSLLRSGGADIKAFFTYPDHYDYTKSDLARFYQKAADENVKMIVTTEKDAVRLNNLKPEAIWALRIELKVIENKEWETLLLTE